MRHEGEERFITGSLPLADLWIPEGTRARLPTEGMRQRLLAHLAPIMAVVVLFWHIPLLAHDPVVRLPRIVTIVVCCLALATPYWLQRFSVNRVSFWTLVAGHVGVVASFLANGGLSGPVSLSLVCLPLVTAVLFSPLAGWIETAAIFLLGIALEVFADGGGLVAPVAPPETRPYLRLMNLAFALFASMLVVDAFFRLNRTHREKLQQLAHRDHLTDLFNRHHVWQIIPAELAGLSRSHTDAGDVPFASKPALGVAIVDIDHFKRVNDTWGHSAGDRALREFAFALESATREADVLARWGGEEFLTLQRNLIHGNLAESPRRLLDTIRGLVLEPAPDERLAITCSIGFTSVPAMSDGQPVVFQHVIRLAEAALAEAKSGGRDRAVGFLWTRPVSREEFTAAGGDPHASLASGALERRVTT